MKIFHSKSLFEEKPKLESFQNLSINEVEFTTYNFILNCLGLELEENFEIAKKIEEKIGKSVNYLFMLSESEWNNMNIPLGPLKLIKSTLFREIRCVEINISHLEALMLNGMTKSNQGMFI